MYFFPGQPSKNPAAAIEYIEKSYLEIAPFALRLYGKLCVLTERLGVARETYKKALKLNPFLFMGAWESGVLKTTGGENKDGKEEKRRGFGVDRIFEVSKSVHIRGNFLGRPRLWMYFPR